MPSNDPFQTWLDSLTDQKLFAVMLLAEARGEDTLGRQMVAAVVMNRITVAKTHERQFGSKFWWGDNVRSVILKPWQFSSFNETDPNRSKMSSFLQLPLWGEAMEIAASAVAGTLGDPSHGADSYLNPAAVKTLPPWATLNRQTAQHLHHTFYRTR